MSSATLSARRSPLLALIGNTPLLELRFEAEALTIFAKAEFLNPSGSIKDRLALTIIDDAEERGVLGPDSIILECTSGNTGIALAMVGAAKGYRVKILMSESASVERRHLIRHFGGEVQLFKTSDGYATGIDLSREMAAADARYFLPCQFENPLNAHDHETQTGPEILRQIPGGRVDAFVSGYGTGGTITGCGRALKAARAETRIVAMEPAEAAMLSGEMPCCHTIEGVAGGYIPPLVREAPIDEKRTVSSEDAMHMTRRLAREFGLLVGTSSGANICAALAVARDLGPAAQVVTILCDRAERYYSTRLFQAERP
ncbi:PLP-dependent cysteine synthase family protein [Synoicihabitans lomoniglobus]|uniref:cysteine synthase n=1 Tax=Synoicihabitans lomoniglobus TaxID=2909285 RepID=A0AAF0CPE5_9BACT|nr:cysteine synthase family protein [Opitutaceae bacterium LMO-M01]WED64324.1 cysteine synthase family protein [Opitutaceae bacterium LMO-M01]